MVRRSIRALGAPVLCISVLGGLLAGCGGGSQASATTVPGGSPTSGAPAAANDASTAPTLTMPASRFAISLDDLGTAFITDVPDTFVLNATNYGTSKTFADGDNGEKLLNDWGYLGGYETSFRPEGSDKAILSNGAYQLAIETHLFKDESGAKKAYDYFDGRLKAGAAQPVNAPQLGNKSSAWKLVQGKIGTSTVDAAYHRFMFRRGNLVTVVMTYGADPFMSVTTVRDLARIVDAKALGQKDAVEPTPTGNYVTPTPSPKQSPSPAATASR
jgi:hypothetical protein